MAIHKPFPRLYALCLALLIVWGAGIGNAYAQKRTARKAVTAKKVAEGETLEQDTMALAPVDTTAVEAPAPLTIAVFSYSKAYNSMAEIASVKEKVEVLKKEYADELKVAEEEFNNKFEDFLKTQGKLAPAIRNKRQADIQQLLKRGMEFKAEAKEALKAKEAELLAPLKQKLQEAINAIAQENGYTIIINTDNDACPFVQTDRVPDLTERIIQKLQAQ